MKTSNYIFSLFMIILALFAYIYTNNFMEMKGYDLGPAFFPKLISIIILFLSILLIIKTFVDHRRTKKDDIIFKKNEIFSVVLGTVMIVIYFLFIDKIGFILASLLFLILFMRLLKIKKLLISVPISFITTFVIYYLFQYILKVQLPSGIWL